MTIDQESFCFSRGKDSRKILRIRGGTGRLDMLILSKDITSWYDTKTNVEIMLRSDVLRLPVTIKYQFVCLLVWVYGISTLVGYFMLNLSLYKYTVLFQTIQFNISTQFNCQKHFYFKLFILIKQF